MNQNTQDKNKMDSALEKLEDKFENDSNNQSLDDLCSGYDLNTNIQNKVSKLESDVNMNVDNIEISSNSQQFYYFYQGKQ